MIWEVKFSKIGERDFREFDRAIQREIIDRIKWLAENFEDVVPLPLHGQWKGFFKLRAGDWRIVYKFESSRKLITISIIDHRSKIYKRR